VVVYLIFTRIWPVSVESAVRAHLHAALAGLKRLAALAPERRPHAIPDAALLENEVGKATEALELIPFEPPAIRPRAETQESLREVADEIGALARDIYLGRDAGGTPARIGRLEAALAR
jgi:multidrug resistance protein MdtO